MTMQQSAITDQVEVFEAILDRLRDQIPEFNKPNTCFIVADPEQFLPEERQTLCLTVAPHAGDFDAEAFTGGGDDVVLERSGFTVTVWSRIKLDRPDEQTIAVKDTQRGLFPLKQKILRAILVDDTDGEGWMPTDNAGAPLLTDYIAPVSAGFPAVMHKGCITLSIAFSLNWAWDLSAA